MNNEFIGNCFKMVEMLRDKFEIDDMIYINDIPASYYKIIDVINHVETITVTELSIYLGVSQPNCSRSIRKLLEKGYIGKVDDPEDKRNHILSLTHTGKDLIEKNHRMMNQTISKCLATFEPVEIESLNDSIKHVIKKINTLNKL